jgi:hypothetical protein
VWRTKINKEEFMSNELELEVFKAGDYGPKGTWGEAELDGLAADYDPKLHEAPVTVDHAQRGPALGWVAGLRRVGDRLVARLKGMNEKLMEMIRGGAFKKRSVEIYPTLKESGRPYLRAVSFLGAASPEVKGLEDPLFGEGEEEAEAVRFEMEEEEMGIDSDTDNESEKDQDQDKQKEIDSDSANESDSENPISEAFGELRGRLQGAGRWRPGWGERGIGEFWAALAAIDEIAVGEDQTIDAAEWFARFLEELPPVVTMGEAAPAEPMSTAGGVPKGGNVDPASLTLHRRVVRFMDENKGIDYGEALRRCAE